MAAHEPFRSPGSPVPWLLGALAGVALQLQQSWLSGSTDYLIVCALGVTAGLGAAWTKRGFRRLIAVRWPGPSNRAGLCLALLAGLLLGFGSTGWRAEHFARNALAPELEGRDIELTGRVLGLPQPGPDALRFRLQVEQAFMAGRPVALPPVLLLAWYGPRDAASALDDTESVRRPGSLSPGERWRMTVRLKAPHGGRNPHGFDRELWLWEQGVQAVGYARTGARHAPPERLAAATAVSVDALRQRAREAIFQRVSDPALAGIVAALVMGDQAAIERSDWDVFRATGVAHLMSISGLHITLFAWLAARLLGALWLASARFTPRLCLALPAQRAGAWGGLLLAAGYALFAGWGLPAQRTVLMLAVAVLLQQGRTRWPWPMVWLVAMAAVVALDPWALMQAGFWLSFVAVGMLLALGAREPQRAVRPGRWWRPALALGREQLAITLALAPLGLVLFQQVSLVGLLANLLAIPWVTWLVTPVALLGLLLPPLWSLAGELVAALLAALQPLAGLPWAVLERPAVPWPLACAGLAGGVLAVLRVPAVVRLLGLPLALPMLLWQPLRPASGEMELLALDVGQGTAVLVRTARHSLLYDAGPRYSRESDAGHRVLVPVLRALGERLDVLLLSHADSDHTGGAAAVRAAQPQARVLASFGDAPQAWGRAAGPTEPCVAGRAWQWDGVTFELLHPPQGDLDRLAKPNHRSCVLRVRSASGVVALLPGDLEAAQEKALVQRLAEAGQLAPVDWLLVPHHGSKTSSSAEWLDALSPKIAVVQASYRSRFGHPAPEVVDRHLARGVDLLDTPACGAVHWQSSQPGRTACQRQLDRRYWHHPGASARPG